MTTTTAACHAVNLQDYAVLLLKHANVTIIVTVATRLAVTATTTMTTKTVVPLLKRHSTLMATSPRILSLKETSPLVSGSRKPLNLIIKCHDSMNGPLVLKNRALIPVSVKGFNTRMQSTVNGRLNATKTEASHQ